MALFNYATKEITLKIVYYGPGLSGKTTNLQQLHSVLDSQKTGKLLSLATETDRTLFFDFLPVELGKIKDFSVRFQLYTVPGQVKYNATRKVVLKGADAVVFVADSQREMREANLESFANMRENLQSNNINPDDIPLVLQYNKRDLSDILSINELNKDLNQSGQVYLEAEAINGKGVKDAFQTITKLLIKDISRRHKLEIQPAAAPPEETVSKPVKEEKIPVAEPVEVVSAVQEPVLEEAGLKEPASFEEIEIVEEETHTEEPITFEKPAAEKITKKAEPETEPETAEAPVSPMQRLDQVEERIKETNQLLADFIGKEEQWRLKEPEIREVPVFPVERLDLMEERIKETNQLISGLIEKEEKRRLKEPEIREAPAFPAEKIERMNENLKETNQHLMGLKASVKELFEEIKKLKEEQKEILTIIRGVKINEAIERIKSKEKVKKGWLGLK